MDTKDSAPLYGNLILANVTSGWPSLIFLGCAIFYLGLAVYKALNE